jgi:SagB-type dehydrogenase family enzyme
VLVIVVIVVTRMTRITFGPGGARAMALFRKRNNPPPPEEVDAPTRARRVVRAYHQASKHDFQRFAAGPGWLDWDTQPDPFRRFVGAELVPLDHPEPATGPAWDATFVPGAVPPAPLDRAALSQLLFDSLALSAWKKAGDATWSLRVNPSSGNLHPTEAYVVCGRVAGLVDTPVVAHYAPREHGLEVRCRPDLELFGRLFDELPESSLVVGLSSIHWREAWKYGERAYRYCNHDVGHALGAIGIAAAALGWRARLLDDLGSDEVASVLGLADTEHPEAEEPDCLIAVFPADATCAVARLPADACREVGALARTGVPNTLSPDHVDWDAIESVALAARKPAGDEQRRERPASSLPWIAEASADERDVLARELVRGRRSAVAMDGRTSMERAAFERILARTLPGAGRVPFDLWPWRPRVHLALFVHRVTDLEPGMYVLVRDPDAVDALRGDLREEFPWEATDGAADGLPLFRVHRGDVRGFAARVSCGQEIAADGCFSLGMLAAFDEPLEEHGAWVYPRLYWECGLVGQVLYLEAEAAGLSATGIGCFFDEPVHAILGMRGTRWQSLYHFTVGGAVLDERVQGRPAYPPPDPASDAT